MYVVQYYTSFAPFSDRVEEPQPPLISKAQRRSTVAGVIGLRAVGWQMQNESGALVPYWWINPGKLQLIAGSIHGLANPRPPSSPSSIRSWLNCGRRWWLTVSGIFLAQQAHNLKTKLNLGLQIEYWLFAKILYVYSFIFHFSTASHSLKPILINSSGFILHNWSSAVLYLFNFLFVFHTYLNVLRSATIFSSFMWNSHKHSSLKRMSLFGRRKPQTSNKCLIFTAASSWCLLWLAQCFLCFCYVFLCHGPKTGTGFRCR